MGQGADDADAAGWAHEVDDAYETGLITGTWTQRDGAPIKVANMTLKHLYGARRVAERARDRACFTNIQELWQSWVDLFDDEIFLRERKVQAQHTPKAAPASTEPKAAPQAPRGKMQWMKCHCGTEYQARTADVKRGWGLSCSKRCAAIRRDFGRPAAKKINR